MYVSGVGILRWTAGAGRRRLGRAVHNAGGATRADVQALRSEIEQLRDELHGQRTESEARIGSISSRIDPIGQAHDEIAGTLAWTENMLAIESFGRFIRYAQLTTGPLVSVVLPTYNRPDRLRRAVDSVVRQRYGRWELLVVDDGGAADSRSVVDAVNDDRISWMRIEHRGACAARNTALGAATGDIIAYLDDDNVMDSDWLHSVVWAFEQRPDVDVLYGAFVIDDVLRVGGEAAGALPRAFLRSWSREALRHGNLADMGAIAHRSGLEQARFDESLQAMGDWELLLRLTEESDPLVLPAIACYYLTDDPERLTLGPTSAADQATVMARAAAMAES